MEELWDAKAFFTSLPLGEVGFGFALIRVAPDKDIDGLYCFVFQETNEDEDDSELGSESEHTVYATWTEETRLFTLAMPAQRTTVPVAQRTWVVCYLNDHVLDSYMSRAIVLGSEEDPTCDCVVITSTWDVQLVDDAVYGREGLPFLQRLILSAAVRLLYENDAVQLELEFAHAEQVTVH